MALRKTINKDKSDFSASTALNTDTVSIPVGSPCIWKCAGDANDGLGVIVPSSSTAVKATSLFAGVALRTAAVGERFDALTSGFALNALYSRGTRAATTSAWPSFVAIGLGDQCVIDTVANAFAYSTVGAQGANGPMAVVADAGQTIASTTTAASNAYSTSNPAWSTATAATLLMKMIVRSM